MEGYALTDSNPQTTLVQHLNNIRAALMVLALDDPKVKREQVHEQALEDLNALYSIAESLDTANKNAEYHAKNVEA